MSWGNIWVGPGRVGRHLGNFGTGPAPSGGLGRDGGPIRRFWTGWMTLGEVQDGF